jgi:hypothetical protein
MLSIQKCRELMGNSEDLTDEEIEKIRASLYEMAELALDCYFEKVKESKPLQ